MLNSTKTWQEDKIKHTAEHIGVISEGALKTLVTDIRKKDMEALIKMLPKEGDEKYELSPTDRQIGYDIALETIKDYYEN